MDDISKMNHLVDVEEEDNHEDQIALRTETRW